MADGPQDGSERRLPDDPRQYYAFPYGGERGPQGDHGQQGEKGDTGKIGFNGWQLIAFIIVVIAAAWGNYQAYAVGEDAEKLAAQNAELIAQQEAETEERRDAACVGAERQHKQELVELEDSYDIFVNPPKGFEETLKDPRFVDSLRDQIKAAKNDADQFGVFVSPFCDDPGIGEPEPDPEMPKQPEGVKDILNG